MTFTKTKIIKGSSALCKEEARLHTHSRKQDFPSTISVCLPCLCNPNTNSPSHFLNPNHSPDDKCHSTKSEAKKTKFGAARVMHTLSPT